MRIFISYRRGDEPELVRLLAAELADVEGVRAVFHDIDSIEAGAVFPERLRAGLASADVVLVAIGPRWPTDRLHAQTDWVREEIRQALSGRARVIPVLMKGAPMPPPDALPEALHGLAERNAVSVRGVESLRADLMALTTALFGQPRLPQRKVPRPLRDAFARVGAAVALWIVGWLVAGQVVTRIGEGQSLAVLLGGRVGVLLAAIGSLVAMVYLAFFAFARRR